jgi:Tfp pilus assembly PilM family ATPase
LPAAIRPNERDKTLRTGDTKLSPTLALADAVLSTNEIGVDYTGDRRAIANLTTAAIPRAQVESMRKLMVLAGCEPRAIDLSAAGLMRALVRVRPDATEVHTIVDVGETSITVATRQGPHLRSVRVIALGGMLLTRAIMAETEEKAPEAIERRQRLRLALDADSLPVSLPAPYGSLQSENKSQSSLSSFDEAIQRATTELIDSIASAIENDASSFNNTFTQGVVLTGRTSQISGFKNLVNQRVGVPVNIGRPWARLEKTRFNLPHILPDQTTEYLMSLSTAIGLALWRAPS